MSGGPSKGRVWAIPGAIGVLSAVGLVAALVADGVSDVVSWFALGVPVAVALWYAFRPS